jgi:hypothetical protein
MQDCTTDALKYPGIGSLKQHWCKSGIFFSPVGFFRAGTSIANAIDLGSALKVSKNGDSSNYPDTALSGCADPADYNNGTMGDGGDVVSAGRC